MSKDLKRPPERRVRDSIGRIPTLGGEEAEASPRAVGPFRLLVELGRGGQGGIWKAWDPQGGRHVVIKLVPPDVQNAEEEMARVKETFAKIHALHHEHICPLYLLGEDEELGYYLVMQYIVGQTLSAYRRAYAAKRGSFPVEEVVRVLGPVASALDYAHRQRVIHRDIKPANILVIGEGEDVQVVDFGLATEIRTSMSRVSMIQMEVSGTRPYMAPEQWRGEYQDAKTDQYALAVVAFELLTGHLPFESVDFQILREAVLTVPAPEADDQPEHVDRALARAMSKRRQDRFSACRDFIDALRGTLAAAGPPPAPDASPAVPPPQPRETAPIQPAAPATSAPSALPKKVVVKCPECGTRLKIEERHAGKEVNCPKCRTRLEVSEDLQELAYAAELVDMPASEPPPSQETAPVEPLSDSVPRQSAASPQPPVPAPIAETPPAEAPAFETPATFPQEGPAAPARGRRLPPSPIPIPGEGAGQYGQPPHVARRETPAKPAAPNLAEMLGLHMKRVSAGEFLMGSPASDEFAQGNEKPQHPVRILRPFFMAVCPVTIGQFRHFVEATGYRTEAELRQSDLYWSNSGWSDDTDNHPAVLVSWNDADAFCQWLSRQEGATYRLPTEAEWEYACRAGGAGRYFFGDDPRPLGEWAWFKSNSGLRTCPVGQKRANEFGLCDMLGNVWEWCGDWFDPDYYQQRPATDRGGPAAGQAKVVRGGSFYSKPEFARCACRAGWLPDYSDTELGFRIVREV